MNTVPGAESALPSLFAFTRQLSRDYQSGVLRDAATAHDRMHTYYTRHALAAVDQVIPGWEKMASYNEGRTLLHVTNVLTVLPLLPEYQQADPETQRLAQWVVLFHDVQKEPVNGQRDWRHGFRSAALTGLRLGELGFDAPASSDRTLQAWACLTDAAIITHPTTGAPIHDHRKLPQIVAGIDRIFGPDTPAALVVKAVLFHMSIHVILEWPPAVALTDDEISRYLTPALLPLLEIMMHADNDSYQMFDEPHKLHDRESTRRVFRRIRSMLGVPDRA